MAGTTTQQEQAGIGELVSSAISDITTLVNDQIELTKVELKSSAENAGRAFGLLGAAAAVGGMFGLYFRDTPPTGYAEVMECDKEAFNRFFHAMLAEGVYLAPSAYEAGFVSAAHGSAEIERTIKAAASIFAAF